ncbi:ShlB/FhaC/HecB family hemolysin secretion/activation protein [Erythrobacter sp. YT30]|uniref:ShlB/FhaC/HecB family hemolysin secretion/activation protein n=1 Tax=Erythrobacter sp. YT30 TaxID=1735012 RepID=UPI0012E38F94|nr:ShlB/FhaC/HecB family hemolysin secretion/activation protein [Erythrobacter sp. YT30]
MALNDFFGETLTEERLAELTNEVAQLARDQGFDYASSEIVGDPNALGIVEVRLNEGSIDVVEIEGYDNSIARRILDKLKGASISKADLERALLLVSDIPAVRLRNASFEQVDGLGVLSVKLSRRDNAFGMAADNYGSASFGPVRARIAMAAGDVLSGGDQVRAAVRVNPVDVGELLFLSASYETKIGNDGLTLTASGSVGTTAPGGAFNDTDISGESARAGLQVTHPVARGKKASLWVEGRSEYISIEQDDLNAMLRDDTVVTASVGLRTQVVVPGGRIRAGVSHVRGLDLFGATRLGDPIASRSDGDGVFSKVEFWSDARFSLSDRVDLFFAMGGQIADRPLLGSEELALGGAYRTRGYNFSEVLGDEGFYGLAELRYNVNTDKLPLDRLQLYGFVDGGTVNDIEQDFGEGSLFSAGPGVRARMGVLDVELEGGFPLGGSGKRSDDGPQINLRAGVNF